MDSGIAQIERISFGCLVRCRTPGKDNSFECKTFGTKINQQSHLEFVGPEVVHYFSQLNVFQLDDCFDLNQHFSFDDKIRSSRADRLNQIFIKNILVDFPGESKAGQFEFIGEGAWINNFLKSIPKKFMYFK